jgi:hypothetical protein
MNEIYANDYRDLEHLVERMEEFIDWRFFREVRHIWRKWLSRRTRGNGMTRETFAALLRNHPQLPFLEWCRESRLRNPLR